MSKIRVLKLGTECRDKATNAEGSVTHWSCNMGLQINYLFQPKGLNPENGQPLGEIGLELERLIFDAEQMEEVEVPIEILGSQVTDKASSFVGMAVSFVRHINGCFHVFIQPSGLLPTTNSIVKKRDFDLRGCVGEKIPVLNAVEQKKSEADNPSPREGALEDFPGHK